MINKLKIELTSYDGKGIWLKKEYKIEGTIQYLDPEFCGENSRSALEKIFDFNPEFLKQGRENRSRSVFISIENSQTDPLKDNIYRLIEKAFYDVMEIAHLEKEMAHLEDK